MKGQSDTRKMCVNEQKKNHNTTSVEGDGLDGDEGAAARAGRHRLNSSCCMRASLALRESVRIRCWAGLSESLSIQSDTDESDGDQLTKLEVFLF